MASGVETGRRVPGGLRSLAAAALRLDRALRTRRSASLHVVAILAVTVCVGAARADEPVALEVPNGPFHVGDPVTLSARVPTKAGEELVAPDLGGSLGKLAVREVHVVPPAPDAQDRAPRLSIVVQGFETGTIDVPPVPFQVREPGGKLDERTTGAGKLELASVLSSGEAQRKPADLAPPAELAFSRRKLWMLAAAVGALLLVGALLGSWLAKRFGGEKARPSPPPVPADLQALGDLDRLLGGQTLSKGELRRFHIELSAILKRYLESRFAFPAVERTTGEVERDLRRLAVDPLAQQPALEVLRACDRIKFANAATSLDESRERAAMVRGVVERTRGPLAEDRPAARA